MTTGFAQAYARIVSQATQLDNKTESITSWDEYCQPVVPSGDEDNFEDEEIAKKKGTYNHYEWKIWSLGVQQYLYQESNVPEALWVLAGKQSCLHPISEHCIVHGCPVNNLGGNGVNKGKQGNLLVGNRLFVRCVSGFKSVVVTGNPSS